MMQKGLVGELFEHLAGSLLQPIVAPLARLLAPWLLISPKWAVDQIMYAATGPPSQVPLLCNAVYTGYEVHLRYDSVRNLKRHHDYCYDSGGRWPRGCYLPYG